MTREQLAEILTERELQAWLCATRLPPSSGQDRVGARRVGLVLGISRERARELLRNAARKIHAYEEGAR